MGPTQDKKSYGALIGSVIIIVILVLGGIYFWMSKQNEMMDTQPATENVTETSETQDTTLIDLENLEAEIEAGASAGTAFDVNSVE
ncbi:MAG: hypothetical protein ACK4FA_00750 [Candidatus Paceibacteria bacterium]